MAVLCTERGFAWAALAMVATFTAVLCAAVWRPQERKRYRRNASKPRATKLDTTRPR